MNKFNILLSVLYRQESFDTMYLPSVRAYPVCFWNTRLWGFEQRFCSTQNNTVNIWKELLGVTWPRTRKRLSWSTLHSAPWNTGKQTDLELLLLFLITMNTSKKRPVTPRIITSLSVTFSRLAMDPKSIGCNQWWWWLLGCPYCSYVLYSRVYSRTGHFRIVCISIA